MVMKREKDIQDGLFRVDINEQSPSNAVEATPAPTAEATAAS